MIHLFHKWVYDKPFYEKVEYINFSTGKSIGVYNSVFQYKRCIKCGRTMKREISRMQGNFKSYDKAELYGKLIRRV